MSRAIAVRRSVVGTGRNEMPAFGRAMKSEDLHDVATYIVEQLVK